MAEIFGAGLTHYPALIAPDEDKMYPLLRTLKNDERLPESLKDPMNWPEAMRVEFGDDDGYTAAQKHRERLVAGFRKVRQEIQAFNPDFIVIFGDDQYENFREDVIAPFCVLAYDEFNCSPFTRADGSARRNVWDEPADKVFNYQGHPEAARYLTSGLINQGVDMAYAYRPLHEPGLAHAFINTLLYLDYDREGFSFPVVPMAVNCYGRGVISQKGGALPVKVNGVALEPDPPGPTAKRCMQVGAALARVLKESPYRVALVASSSWSHAFLTAKNNYLWPDTPSDREMLSSLKEANYGYWSNRTTAELEDAGQHELLNWACMLGAMEELNAKPDYVEWVETDVLTSNKCFATFKT